MKISIDAPATRFTEHLHDINNSRILLTGKFGTGKSHFLRNYFTDRKEEYNLFWLSPIHYVVGANQDIFEWIKVDIAQQLLPFILDERQEKISKNFLLQSYIYQNPAAIFTELSSFIIGKVTESKTGVNVVDTLKDNFDEFKKYKEALQSENKTNLDKLNNYIKESLEIKGSIFEDNLTTQIIRANIAFLMEISDKENVLVIDDLDRLDPEHIFRILNILSAHNDHFDSNKYGFNRVIIVCDIKNIEGIYKHRFGEETDFDGYVEKFYFYEPFHFNLNDAVAQYCEKESLVDDLDVNSRVMLALLLQHFVAHGKLKIRNLAKITTNSSYQKEIDFNVREYNIKYPGSVGNIGDSFIRAKSIFIHISKYDFIKVVFLLSRAFGGISKFRKALLSFKDSQTEFNYAHIPSVLKSIAVLSHISKSFPELEEKAFFRTEEPATNSYVNIVYPHINFFGKKETLRLKWNYSNPRYEGGDYFVEADLSAIEREINNFSMKQKICTIANLVAEIIPIVDFLIRESIIKNIEP